MIDKQYHKHCWHKIAWSNELHGPYGTGKDPLQDKFSLVCCWCGLRQHEKESKYIKYWRQKK